MRIGRKEKEKEQEKEHKTPPPKKTGTGDGRTRSAGMSERTKFWLGFGVIALLVTFVVLGLYLLKASMFEQNPHFVVHKVNLEYKKGDSYWNPAEPGERQLREKDLRETFHIELDRTNLFSVDFGALRSSFLKQHPEVSDLTLWRELPDTLRIKIQERVLALKITGLNNGECYIADDFTVVDPQYVKSVSVPCVSVKGDDPDFNTIQIGMNVKNNSFVKQVKSLIDLRNGSYTNIFLKQIDYRPTENGIWCDIVYENTQHTLILPLRAKTDELNDILAKVKKQFEKGTPKTYDLRFENQNIRKKTEKN